MLLCRVTGSYDDFDPAHLAFDSQTVFGPLHPRSCPVHFSQLQPQNLPSPSHQAIRLQESLTGRHNTLEAMLYAQKHSATHSGPSNPVSDSFLTRQDPDHISSTLSPYSGISPLSHHCLQSDIREVTTIHALCHSLVAQRATFLIRCSTGVNKSSFFHPASAASSSSPSIPKALRTSNCAIIALELWDATSLDRRQVDRSAMRVRVCSLHLLLMRRKDA